MALHLSARLVWHDRGWDGHICNQPGKNSYCEGHIVVRAHKDTKLEQKNTSKNLAELEKASKPACESTPQAFCARDNSIIHYPPSFMTKAMPQLLSLSPYSMLNWTFEEMWDEDGGYRSQEERLRSAKEFYSDLKQHLDKSLVFFYVDERNPIGEETANRIGQRILVGVAKLKGIGDVPIGYWDQKIPKSDEKYMMWAVEIKHGYPEEGVRIPYQEYLARNIPVGNIAIPLAGDLRERFKWVGKHIDDDTATVLVEKIMGSIRAVSKEGLIEGNWESKLIWLNNILKDVWTERGPYPGIKSVLKYLDKEGEWALFQKEIVSVKAVAGKEDFLITLRKWLDGIEECDVSKFKEYIDDARDEWDELNNDEKALLLKFCRFELSEKHIGVILSDEKRKEHGITSNLSELSENPYLLCEEYLGSSEDDYITFETIDLGMMPSEYVEIRDKIKNDDRRRVRALIIEKLKFASQEGNTFLSAKDVLDYITKKCPEKRKCEIELKRIISEKNKDFYDKKLDIFELDGVTYFALKSIKEDEEEVQNRIQTFLERDVIEKSDIDWKDIIKNELKLECDDEQINSLKKCFKYPFSIITGEAGTGKSTLVSALMEGIRKKEGRTRILVLTPTGKAADRLKEIGVKDAKTIHKELSEKGWFNWTTLTFKRDGGGRIESENIIIDESSMVDIALFATLLRAINWDIVKRFILVGDYHQLPPIGPGRPFYDIIQHLQKNVSAYGQSINELENNFRIKKGSNIIALASSYARHPEYNESDLFKKIALQEGLGDLKVVFWKDDSDLYDKIISKLNELIQFTVKQNGGKEYELFNQLLKNGADIWQIITATRQNYFGTAQINKYIQEKYHGQLIKGSRKIKVGNEQITYLDKVIQIINDKTRIVEYEGRFGKYQPVFNGQIGLAYPKFDNKGLRVVFDRIPNAFYHYDKKDVSGMLELAYAITVHKSQGSQFKHTFFVVPKEACKLLSRELIYTGLTRAKEGLTLFLQDDIEPLFTFRSLDKSEILNRNSRLFEIFIVSGPYRKEGLIHITQKGEKVRSKSEVIIANFLNGLGVDYRYEERLYNKDGDKNDFRIPDFTIYREGRVWYLEHCGMTHDKDYVKKWENERVPWYNRNGYEKQLIVTYDKQIDRQGVITKEVYETIKTVLKLK